MVCRPQDVVKSFSEQLPRAQAPSLPPLHQLPFGSRVTMRVLAPHGRQEEARAGGSGTCSWCITPCRRFSPRSEDASPIQSCVVTRAKAEPRVAAGHRAHAARVCPWRGPPHSRLAWASLVPFPGRPRPSRLWLPASVSPLPCFLTGASLAASGEQVPGLPVSRPGGGGAPQREDPGGPQRHAQGS